VEIRKTEEVSSMSRREAGEERKGGARERRKRRERLTAFSSLTLPN
jgi:hypothetical protein